MEEVSRKNLYVKQIIQEVGLNPEHILQSSAQRPADHLEANNRILALLDLAEYKEAQERAGDHTQVEGEKAGSPKRGPEATHGQKEGGPRSAGCRAGNQQGLKAQSTAPRLQGGKKENKTGSKDAERTQHTSETPGGATQEHPTGSETEWGQSGQEVGQTMMGLAQKLSLADTFFY